MRGRSWRPDSIGRAPAEARGNKKRRFRRGGTAVTECTDTDTAPGPGRARRPRRAAGRFGGLPIGQAAMRFARARHSGQHRDIDNAPFIAHPIEVGRLLCGDCQPDATIAAGLLYDAFNQTATTGAEIHRRFGGRIARVVESVSDDPSLGDYKSRKRDLRDRVAPADPGARAVFVADKIAKVRELAPRAAWQLNKPKNRAKLAHYRASLETLRRVDGNTLLIHRLDSPIAGTRGRRNSQPRTGHDRDRLELVQASSSSNLNDVRPRSRGIGRKVARPPRRMPSVGRARVAVGAGSIRSLLGTKPARDGRPLRFSDFRAGDKPIAVT